MRLKSSKQQLRSYRAARMEVMSISDFEKMIADREDNVIIHAVDQLESLAGPRTHNSAARADFGDTMDLDLAAKTFDFVHKGPVKWPGPSYSTWLIHDKIIKPSTNKKKKKSSGSGSAPTPPGRTQKSPASKRFEDWRKPTFDGSLKIPGGQSHSQSRGQKGLLDLPPEIRNAIWSLLAVHKDPIEAQLRRIRPVRRGKSAAHTVRKFPREPSLAATNRQLQHEVLSIFYGTNRFVFNCEQAKPYHGYTMNQPECLQQWRPRPDIAKFIASVDVRFATTFSPFGRPNPGSTIIHSLRRSSDDGQPYITVSLERSTTTKGFDGLSYCLCDERKAHRKMHEPLPDSDLIDVAVELVRARKSVFAPRRTSESGESAAVNRKPGTSTCGNCGKKCFDSWLYRLPP